MGKKKTSSGTKYTSAGKHSNVSKSTLTAMRAGKSEAEKLIDKQTAWLAGKNPTITIPNPLKEETNRPYIKRKANELWGNPKELAKRQFMK